MADGAQNFPAKVEFHAVPVATDADLTKHIEHCLSLGLPEAIPTAPALTVIANGPSALNAPLDGPTLALNGALGMMLAKGVKPTYWACCDPQAMVVDFLKDAPAGIVYFVASKCHPDVFKRLEGNDVRVFHVDDVDLPKGYRGVRHTSTITLTSLALMHQLGWRRFDVWGWDGCFLDGRHHANQTHDIKSKQITVDIEGRQFETTHAWALEAEEALYILQIADYSVEIHGDGMIAAYTECLRA